MASQPAPAHPPRPAQAAPEQTPLAAPRASPPPAPVIVAVSLDSRPSGAVAVIDGQRILLPIELRRPEGSHVPIRVEKPGYEPSTLELVLTPGMGPQVVDLKRRPSRRPPPALPPGEDRPLYLEPAKSP